MSFLNREKEIQKYMKIELALLLTLTFITILLIAFALILAGNIEKAFAMTYKAESGVVLIDEVIEELAVCESSNRHDAINHNDGKTGEHSRGLLQFKEATFHHFGERYGLPHDDIWDVEQQKAIAKRMLAEKRWTHWYSCLEGRFE
jgi:hypothetical protein